MYGRMNTMRLYTMLVDLFIALSSNTNQSENSSFVGVA